MEDYFLNFLFGVEFQGVIGKVAEGRQFSSYDPTGECTIKILKGAGLLDGEGVTEKDA